MFYALFFFSISQEIPGCNNFSRKKTVFWFWKIVQFEDLPIVESSNFVYFVENRRIFLRNYIDLSFFCCILIADAACHAKRQTHLLSPAFPAPTALWIAYTNTNGGHKMKKIIAMLLALTMVLGLAACGGSSAPAATEAPAAAAPAATEALPPPPPVVTRSPLTLLPLSTAPRLSPGGRALLTSSTPPTPILTWSLTLFPGTTSTPWSTPVLPTAMLPTF